MAQTKKLTKKELRLDKMTSAWLSLIGSRLSPKKFKKAIKILLQSLQTEKL